MDRYKRSDEKRRKKDSKRLMEILRAAKANSSTLWPQAQEILKAKAGEELELSEEEQKAAFEEYLKEMKEDEEEESKRAAEKRRGNNSSSSSSRRGSSSRRSPSPPRDKRKREEASSSATADETNPPVAKRAKLASPKPGDVEDGEILSDAE